MVNRYLKVMKIRIIALKNKLLIIYSNLKELLIDTKSII